jgi:hypothetical protein
MFLEGGIAMLVEKALMNRNPTMLQINFNSLMIIDNRNLLTNVVEWNAVMMPVFA